MKYFFLFSTLLLVTLVSSAPQQSSSSQRRSACQEHRERELRNNRQSELILIPECEENGDYKPRQCHPPATDGKRFCQCWAPNGEILSSPSKQTESCKCHMDRFKAQNPGGTNNVPNVSNGSVGTSNQRRLIGAFVPECENNGKFKTRQCHGSTGHCWCVDPVTGEQKGDRVRGQLTCERV